VKIGSRATTGTSNDKEDQINRLTVGIFSSDGSTVRTIQELSSGSGTGKFTTTSGTTTADIVTTSLANGDQILVAANAPTGEFNGVQTATAFESKTIGVDRALATPSSETAGSTEDGNDNIPMFGSGTISGSGTAYTASVQVQHQLAKITLKSITVAFDQAGPYKSATFKPTSYFLINVANDLAFSYVSWDALAVSASKTYPANQGFSSTTTTGLTDLDTYPYKEYLTTGTLAGASALSVSGTSSITPGNIFYATPNVNTTDNTKLVIAGDFSADGGTTTTPVYYPVNINWVYDPTTKTSSAANNGGATAKAVYPNKNYVCTIVIKTKGSDTPYKPIDPEVASISVTVLPFTEADQTTTFE
jgi:hypothetical protein